ncbi:ComEA family DNA-binding protein [Thermomonospora umbrina]|uniref:ComEA family DNA-binding protein n=1 Tax=Thermomonospora umbrina TaxID=111806 RepID=UPI001FE74A28|nr:ComEA family DNA-binding protein [Thermomonospora umbrina]
MAAALLAGGYFWVSRPQPRPVTDIPAPSAAPAPSVLGPSMPSGVTVHVAGKVRRPGVVTLPAGSRVADALRAAGGLRPGARTGSLNLARRIMDGEQITVGEPSEATAVPPIPGAGAPAAPGAPGARAPLDLNAATVEQLDTLPGVGPVLAQRIIDYRTQNGGFRSVEQLQNVTGIGARRFADLKPLVRV